MVDAEHGDALLCVVDLGDDAVGASSRGPESRQFTLQRVTDSAWVLAQRAEHELDDGGGDAFRKSAELAFGGGGDAQLEAAVAHRRRNLARSCSADTVSPSATS